jgi:hypothetical protein
MKGKQVVFIGGEHHHKRFLVSEKAETTSRGKDIYHIMWDGNVRVGVHEPLAKLIKKLAPLCIGAPALEAATFTKDDWLKIMLEMK